MAATASTGLNGLDEILGNLQKGDNVVWQVESVEDYRQFVTPYVAEALTDGRKVVYMKWFDEIISTTARIIRKTATVIFV